jgi:GT2 family glycosyltransferase
MARKPKVSIIIVHYKAKKELFQCLDSIRKNKTKVTYEIIVVDNDEKKIGKSAFSKYKWVNYFQSPKNLGYGAGNNLGVREAQGEYLLILNPDIEVLENSVENLVNFLDKNEDVGIVAPNLLDKNKNLFKKMGSRRLTPIRAMFVLSFLNKLIPNNRFSNEYYLKGVDKSKLREVDSVPGSALMIRKSVFRKAGMFDENIFMYFEEEDLGKRVKELGYKIFINPKAEIIHYWTSSKGTKKLKKIFARSRFYYFKKHYGIFWAFIIETLTRFSKWQCVLLATLILAAFLRFWRISELMPFIHDFGWYYLSARDFILTGEIPLVGVPSSVPVLRQGAIFTWMLAGTLLLGNFHPVSGAILAGIVGIVAVWGLYQLVSEWFGKKVAVISVIFASTSPFIVNNDRMPFVLAPIFPITVLISWSATKIIKGDKKHYFFLGLFLAFLYQFELAGFIIFPILLVTFIWHRLRPTRINLLKFFTGIILGLAPFIIWDLKQGVYLQTIGFFVWVIIKMVEGVCGIFIGERNLGLIGPAAKYLSQLIFAPSFLISLVIFVISSFYFIRYFFKEKTAKFSIKFIFVWFFVGYLSFFFRGIYSQAYIPLVFVPTILIISLFFEFLIKRSSLVGVTAAVVVAGFNSFYLIRGYNASGCGITFSKRVEVSEFIVSDAAGADYQLVYLGPGYQFASGANHWRYLLWWKGNEPNSRSINKYVIVEYPYEAGKKHKIIKDFGKIKVARVSEK